MRWALAAVAALALGATFADAYARLAAPYYEAVARLVAAGHPWDVIGVDVRRGRSQLSDELQLSASVRRRPEDLEPAAKVRGRVQVGEVIETPLVFWTLLVVWPATSRRQCVQRLMAGIPVFLALEAVTTATHLILPMAQASAILGGHNDPTAWDYWSRFLEAGGGFVVATVAALLTIAIRGRWMPLSPTPPS